MTDLYIVKALELVNEASASLSWNTENKFLTI